MAENTGIEWADHTFNPWTGCQAVSPACDNCYAAQWAKRAGRDFATRQRTKTWAAPKRWNANHAAFFAQHGHRQRVFCASLADVFDNQVPTEWRMDLFELIADTPNLDWLLLTKRIGNVMPMCSGDSLMFDTLGRSVWLGATICNQAEADRDVPKLLAVPAEKRFLSIEPMLGPISFDGMFASDRINDGTNALEELDWVICGGESGPKARPMHPDWARNLRDQCAASGVPFVFKQWGEWAESWGGGTHLVYADGRTVEGDHEHPDAWKYKRAEPMRRVGKQAAGRLLDGVLHDGYPIVLEG